jgi:hypothetical protein
MIWGPKANVWPGKIPDGGYRTRPTVVVSPAGPIILPRSAPVDHPGGGSPGQRAAIQIVNARLAPPQGGHRVASPRGSGAGGLSRGDKAWRAQVRAPANWKCLNQDAVRAAVRKRTAGEGELLP